MLRPRLSFDITPLVTRIIDPSRVLVGVVVLVLAVPAAQRGQAGRALVLGGIGVMLVALARQLLFGDRTPGPDQSRCAQSDGFPCGCGRCCDLVRSRQVDRSARVGVRRDADLVGPCSPTRLHLRPACAAGQYSGAALVLFMTWDLFTGQVWGNQESRRFRITLGCWW